MGCLGFAPQTVRASIIVTTGTAKKDITTVPLPGLLLATGTTGVYARAGDRVASGNELTNAADNVPIGYKQGNVAIVLPGKGDKDAPKYTNGKGNTVTSSANVIKQVGANTTTTTAKGEFDAFDPVNMGNGRAFNSLLLAKGKVDDQAKVRGHAAALAQDPMVFHFDTSGSLSFSLTLGDASASLSDGSTFDFSSDAAAGRNHLDLSASLSGVLYNGKAFDGDIFSLAIDASGPIDSSSDLKIDFVPSPLLNLSPSTIKAVDDYIAGKLTPQADGSVGLAPGTEFDLFGPGSPVGPLTFTFGPGDVTYADSLTISAEATPEPSSWALLGAAGLVLGLRYLRGSIKHLRQSVRIAL
jgi:hypothetical protein